MKLIVVHHHYRPGGVRRVIELAVPHLVRALAPHVSGVVLIGGEAPDPLWLEHFRAGLGALPVHLRLDASVGYVAEHRILPAHRMRRLRKFFTALLAETPGGALVWIHNPGLGRNLAVNRTLARLAAPRRLPVVFHHHDWWFDNRWQRWPEMRRSGFRTLTRVAEAILPAGPHIRHAAINQADAKILRRHFGRSAGWLPNPAALAPAPPAPRVRAARQWLATQLGERAPVWLVPCRLLRRKNIAEALLLARWLRPEAWVVTTGGVSSAEEQDYAGQLQDAASAEGWNLRLGLLVGNEGRKPTVPELLAASEVVLLTSLFEGFGLPYLEAAAAHRPLLARRLPDIAPDLDRFGLRFPHTYDEILIDPTLFDWAGEAARQRHLWASWKQALPRSCRAQAGQPAVLAAGNTPRPVPFSRLTLAAQLEVLRQPTRLSWQRSVSHNPFLPDWRARAATGSLTPTRWSRAATAWLEGSAYAHRFLELLTAAPARAAVARGGPAAQSDFIRTKLRGDNLYPLGWSPRQ